MSNINKSDFYDESNPLSIEEYSKKLENKTFRNILEEYFSDNPEELENKIKHFNNPRGKGSLGNLIEEYFFFFKPNSSPEPDFPRAGVELKVTPIKQLKNKSYSAAERLVLSMIPNDRMLSDDIDTSELINKIALMLVVIYLRDRDLDRIDNKIKSSKLFNLKSDKCKEDFEIIKQDYKKISYKINNGLAHTLSEADTLYLSACTKGATAKKSLQPQFNSDIPAKRRAFSLKPKYMTSIINKFILKNKDTFEEKLIINPEELENTSFEDIILSRLMPYINESESEIMKKLNITKLSSKNKYSTLGFRMLGIKSNFAEEFIKANIVVKAIRIEENNSIKESMSFPFFKISELIKEEWEESNIYNHFSETKFLFIIFKNINNEYIFKGSQFWNMPLDELETIGKEEWLKVQSIFRNGIQLNPVKQKNRIIVKNNLPGYKDTKIFHVRPHANKSIYIINGERFGAGNINTDGDLLPNGDIMTRQCFWLNNSYILNKLNQNFLK